MVVGLQGEAGSADGGRLDARRPAAPEGAARAAGVALRLALGLGAVEVSAADWPDVLAVATRERLVPLCWERSSAWIRSSAPAEIAAAWRARALANLADAARRVALLEEIVATLRGVRVEPIVLKGLPLAERLHGDVLLRPSGDVDLFVPAEGRARADAALAAADWRRTYGAPPREAAYRRWQAGREQVLEIHSSLSDDNLLEHLRFPFPGWRTATIGTTSVRAHDDDLLPAYLATHLAKRSAPPLLWVLDLYTLWDSLDEGEKARANAVARRHRAQRYLERALARTAALRAAADGVPRALALLGYGSVARRDAHNAVVVARFAANPLDAARVALAWAWPHATRGDAGAYARAALDRVRRASRRVTASRPRQEGTAAELSPVQALPVGTPLHEAVRTIVDAGAPVWIRATGQSMRPAILPGARVHLVPLPPRPLARGEVVLAALPSGGSVLHRVRRERDGVVLLRGDNTAAPDAPVPRAEVVALADAIELAGRVRRVPRRGRPTLRALAGDVRRLARTLRPTTLAGRA